MALAEILSAIREEAEATVEEVQRASGVSVAEILRQAREEASRVEHESSTSLDARLEAESEVILNRADLHVQRRLQVAREAIYQEILGRARDRLAAHRRDERYTATLRSLLAECVDFSPSVDRVLVDPRDVEFIRTALDALGLEADVEPALQTWGGMEATDGRGVFVRNTLEARLARATNTLRQRVGDLVPGLRGGNT